MGPREQRAGQTRERIVSTAERIFRERGYHATSLDELIRACGSSKGGFYVHFESKEALLAEIGRRFFAEALASVEAADDPAAPPLERLAAAAGGFLAHCARRRHVRTLLFEARSIPALRPEIDRVNGEWAAQIVALLEEARERGDLAEAEIESLVPLLLGGLAEAGIRLAETPRTRLAASLAQAQAAARTLILGLARTPAPVTRHAATIQH